MRQLATGDDMSEGTFIEFDDSTLPLTEDWVAENFEEERYFEGANVRWNAKFEPLKVVELRGDDGEYMPILTYYGSPVYTTMITRQKVRDAAKNYGASCSYDRRVPSEVRAHQVAAQGV